MKLNKRIIALLSMLLVVSMLAVSCAKPSSQQTEAKPNESTEENKDEKKEDTKDKKEVGKVSKILIVTSPSGVDDGSFNEDNYKGIQDFIKNHKDVEVKHVQESTGDPKSSVQAVADAIADFDTIVVPGFQFAGISEMAEANPDKHFILVDTNPAEINGKAVFDNIYAMTFAEEESGFLAGIAAAFETKTGKVAVVNGIAFPSNVNYQFGFESGVNYAVKNLGAKAELVSLESYAGTDVTGKNVGGNYIGDFSDQSKGKVVGQALIEKGVDVLFVAAGGAGNGVFTAAKEAKDVKVIGCDVDQFDDGVNGSENIVLTSGLKNMRVNVERMLNAIVDGTFKGANELLKADTDSTGYVKAEGRHQLKAETIEKIDGAYKLLKEGKIVPASNFNGHASDNFPGL